MTLKNALSLISKFILSKLVGLSRVVLRSILPPVVLLLLVVLWFTFVCAIAPIVINAHTVNNNSFFIGNKLCSVIFTRIVFFLV